jgi:EipB-like
MVAAVPTRLSLAVFLLCVSGAAMTARAVEVAPHHAVYDLSLKHGGNEVSDVSGSMQFDWEDSCDGWSVTQKTAMTLLYQTGDEVGFGWNVVSWESKDGLRYRFFVRKLENGETTEEFRGEAHLDGPGKGGVAEYTLPEKHTVKLSPGTLFPTAHTIKLLHEIEGGTPLLWATVFDGSDASGIFDVSAAVSTRLKTEAAATGRSPLLTAGPSAHVSLAFFNRDTQGAEPEHEQVLRLHSNGVVESLDLDFGDFTVEGKLKEVRELKPPC